MGNLRNTLKKSFYHFRKPTRKDGAKVWELIKEIDNMDLNSSYCYLMLCEFFSDTCVIAEKNDKIVGFISAFQLPKKRDTVFVWQVVVSQSCRGSGLGKALINELLNRTDCANFHYLEATVSPSNEPSQALFKGLARDLSTNCQISDGFPPHLFPGSSHEEEMNFRIGPFQMKNKKGKVV